MKRDPDDIERRIDDSDAKTDAAVARAANRSHNMADRATHSNAFVRDPGLAAAHRAKAEDIEKTGVADVVWRMKKKR